ncbi:MAG: DUF308 domain-containing protein [Christensenella hongkongensis]|nr:DUF308 domain-containing protein [Christensenella hongkongensis]MDY3004568.1 DUF308 domain-containing protein [Christensenella hongkongensis]
MMILPAEIQEILVRRASEEMMKTNKLDRIVKIILGILLLAVGCLMLAAPVITVVVAVRVAAVALVAAGALQLVFRFLGSSRKAFLSIDALIAIVNILLGILILVFDKAIVLFLPVLVAIWLVLLGVMRIMEGADAKKNAKQGWKRNVGIGVISIIGGVLLVVLQWIIAMNTIGILIAVFSIIYGLVILSDMFVANRRPLTDEEIAAEENADFYRFEEKLHEDDKKDGE